MKNVHTFKATGEIRYPLVGELIRSSCTGALINIVLEIGDERALPRNNSWRNEGSLYREIRSVRYGKVNGGDFLLLDGRRSRAFKWFKDRYNHWEIVKEYTEFNNYEIRMAILERLKNVNTSYVGPEDLEIEF
jgi:hypothetical protein